jgi:hypothetical protein
MMKLMEKLKCCYDEMKGNKKEKVMKKKMVSSKKRKNESLLSMK